MNQELENYIKQARQAGKNDELIKQDLRASGWSEIDITEAFNVKQEPSKIIRSSKPTTNISWLNAKILIILIE